VLSIKDKFRRKKGKRGSTIIELIIVTVLLAILIPIAIELYVSARKISGQSYIQHYAALNLGESVDILRHMRNQGYELLVNGSFYLIRNPGTNSWLIKSELPDKDVYERYITISNALRHEDTDDLYFDGDTGPSYEDPDTKRVDIQILWAPNYIASDLISYTSYVTNWQDVFTFTNP
jgi:type II secretory pathway pseudopilin PulG